MVVVKRMLRSCYSIYECVQLHHTNYGSYELRIITQRIDSRAAQHVLRKIKRGTWIIFHLVHVLQALGKASHAIDLFTRCWNRLISITDSVERDEDGSGKDSLCLSRKIFQLSFLNTVELNATEQAKRLSLPSDKLCNECYLCGDPHSHRYSAWNCVSIVSLRCDKIRRYKSLCSW
jgi:hypothetical protein